MNRLIRSFLRLGVIIGTLPSTINNGAAVDAVPVMNDLNWIVAQANANAASASALAAVQASIATWGPLTAWTPVLAFGGGTAGITYGSATGVYTYMASLLVFYFTMTLTNKGGLTGLATIGGLPANANAALNANSPCGLLNANQLTFADKTLTVTPVPGAAKLNITTTPSGAPGPNFLADTAFVNTTALFGFGMYPT